MRLPHQVIHLYRYLCLPLLALFLVSVASAETPWFLHKNERDVLLWSRDRPDSDLNEVRAVTRIQSNLSAFIALLEDASAHERWVPYSKGARQVDRRNARDATMEITLDAPWPLTDRVVLLDYRWWQTDRRNILHVEVNGRPKEPLEPNTPSDFCTMQAHWTLYPNPDGTLIVEYQGRVNRCGQIPNWITNRVQLNAVWQTLVNMRQIIPQYQTVSVEGIVEPRLYRNKSSQQTADASSN